MSHTSSIRPCTLDDVEELRQLSIQCFKETFADLNTQEDMDKYIAASFSNSTLSECLSNSASNYFFFVIDNTPVGYIKVNEAAAQTELQDTDALEIERIYVLKDHHGTFAGKSLMSHALSLAEQRQKKYAFLGVWEKNHRAIRFYEKNGFNIVDTHVFIIGESRQTDYIMKKELITAPLQN